MTHPFLAVVALFSVHLGFSALFGYWINVSRKRSNWRYQVMLMLLFAILLIGANWTAPFSMSVRVLLAISSTSTIWICAFRYTELKINSDWVWLYAAFSMAAILLWSILQQEAILAISMSLLAFGACLLALQRSKQTLVE